MNVRHFVLTPEGRIHEFTAEQAAMIAAGADRLPEFADSRVRYLQVTVDAGNTSEIRVQTAGANIRFDQEGKMLEASPPSAEDALSGFEHDAVVQWAIRDIPSAGPTFH